MFKISSKSLINKKEYQTSAPNKSTLYQHCKFNDFLVLTLEKSNLLADSLGQRMSIEVTLVAFHVVEDYDVLKYTLDDSKNWGGSRREFPILALNNELGMKLG